MNKFKDKIDTLDAVLLDFDGVLAKSMNVKTEAFTQLFKPFGEDITKKVVKHHIEHGGISRYKKIQYYYEQYVDKPLSEVKLEQIAQQFSDIVVDKVIESDWVKGVKEFLEKYHKTIDLYVISGTPQEEMELIIKKRDMEKYFKGVYGTPDTKPVLAKRIIAENGYNHKKVLYIGDCLSDYHDAKKADVLFLGRVEKGKEPVFPKDIPIIFDFFELF